MDADDIAMDDYISDKFGFQTKNSFLDIKKKCYPNVKINYHLKENYEKRSVSLKASPPGANQKDMSQYQNLEVFLVSSEEDWKDVLRLIPLAMWKGSESCHKSHEKCAYPLMVYHQDRSNLDIESIQLFATQYKASKKTLFKKKSSSLTTGLGASEKTLSLDNYLKYWKTYDTVVISENSYKTGIMASIYAARLNAPLFFAADFKDSTEMNKYASGKKVHTIGRVVGVQATKNLKSIDEVQATFPKTDKVILTNPQDFGVTKGCDKVSTTPKLGKILTYSYCSGSFMAPVLAFMKDEHIIFADVKPAPEMSSDNKAYFAAAIKVMDSTKKIFESQIKGNSYKYLTILASPRAIPFKHENNEKTRRGIPTFDTKLAKANKINGLGRIYGVSLSDVSSYVARAVFFTDKNNKLLKKPASSLFVFEDHLRWKYYAIPFMNYLSKQGVKPNCLYYTGGADIFFTAGKNFLKSINCKEGNKRDSKWTLENPDWANKEFIYIDGHAYASGGFNVLGEAGNIKKSFNSLAVVAACNTLNYYHLGAGGNLYGPYFLRRGGIGFIGAAHKAKENDGLTLREGYGEDILYALSNNPNIGDAIGYVYANDPYGCSLVYPSSYHVFNLLGDPTVSLNIDPKPKKMYVSYYSGIRKGKYEAPDLYSGLNKLQFHIDSPQKLNFRSGTKVRFKDVGGKYIQGGTVSASCSSTSYCSGVMNSRRPFLCTVNLKLKPGTYTCEVQNGKETADCPFWFSIKKDFKIDTFETYRKEGLKKEKSTSFGAMEEVFVEVSLAHKKPNLVKGAVLMQLDEKDNVLAKNNMLCRNTRHGTKLCEVSFVPSSSGKINLLILAEDTSKATVSRVKEISVSAMDFKLDKNANLDGCVGKPLSIKGELGSFNEITSYKFYMPSASSSEIRGESFRCSKKAGVKNRLSCDYTINMGIAKDYFVKVKFKDKTGKELDTGVGTVTMHTTDSSELVFVQKEPGGQVKEVYSGDTISKKKGKFSVILKSIACRGISKDFEKTKITVLRRPGTKIPIKCETNLQSNKGIMRCDLISGYLRSGSYIIKAEDSNGNFIDEIEIISR
jgi:hypothetical protein